MGGNIVNRLPIEVWLKIFDCLKPSFYCHSQRKCSTTGTDNQDDHNHLLSCSQSCFYFYQILQDTIVEWRFLEVLPLIFIRLEAQDVLQCRKVCKTWRHTIDHFLEFEDEYFRLHGDKYSSARDLILGSNVLFHDSGRRRNSPWESLVRQTTYYVKASEINRFKSHVKALPRIRTFPGKTLSIFIDLSALLLYENKNEQFYRESVELLDKFGGQIKVLSLTVRNANVSNLEVFNWLKTLLNEMPNLRRLCIHAENVGRYFPEMFYERLFAEDAPWLPALEALEFKQYKCASFPSLIQQFMAQLYSQQLKRLFLSLWDESRDNNLGALKELPNLEEIRLLVKNPVQVKLFFTEQTRLPKVSKIFIKTRNSEINGKVSLSVFLEPLLAFTGSLETLVLDSLGCAKTMVTQEDVNLIGEFRHLKCLYMDLFYLGKVRISESVPAKVKCLLKPHLMMETKSLPWYHVLCCSSCLGLHIKNHRHTANSKSGLYCMYARSNPERFLDEVFEKLPNLELLVSINPALLPHDYWCRRWMLRDAEQ